jgi:hypothetical protein
MGGLKAPVACWTERGYMVATALPEMGGLKGLHHAPGEIGGNRIEVATALPEMGGLKEVNRADLI